MLLALLFFAYQRFGNTLNLPMPNSPGTSSGSSPASGSGDKPDASRTVNLTIASSSTKRNWMDKIVADFNRQNKRVGKKKIVATVEHVTSGGSMNAILDGSIEPVIWSPGDDSWTKQFDDNWKLENNQRAFSEPCVSTVYAPLGFAMWRPMAEALGWPDKPIGWDTIVDLASDPKGWASYGRPEWGKFTFGHTHPAYANSGLMSMTAFVYGIAKNKQLTAAEIYSPAVEDAMRRLEQNTSKYGKSAPALLELMAKKGTSFLHAAAVPEADTVKFNIERSAELSLPLAFIFPSGGTIWANHPLCILDKADWVDADQVAAARMFRDYLLAPEQQKLAIDNYLRPLDSSIPLHAPLSLEYGTDPRVSTATIPALPSPSLEIANAVIDLFKITKRKATVLVVFDVSGSMEGEKIRTARTATVEFLQRLDPKDEVGVMVFNHELTFLAEPQPVANVAEDLAKRVSSLLADGGTNLYGAVCEAVKTIKDLQEQDLANNESRLYGIVLLSDGEDTSGVVTENQMFATCLPSGVEIDGVKIFPIAFGDSANERVLRKLAELTAGRMFSADQNSIAKVYLSISAEQ